jgi:hypothetical protein
MLLDNNQDIFLGEDEVTINGMLPDGTEFL